jgi:hypothetical protein
MKQLIIASIATLLFTASCTENEKARSYGGTATLDLPKGQKLVNVTWKETDLWYLTRPMTVTDSAVSYTFHEESSFGVWEGTYIINETK